MKCEKCGYTENILASDLEEMRLSRKNPDLEKDRMLCPLCLHWMYPVHSDSSKE
jgi:hypothetical protein